METGSGNEIPTVTSDEPNEVADMAVTVDCPEAGCTGGNDGAAWTYTGDAAIAAVMLDHHLRSHAQPGRQTERRPRPPPLQLPKLSGQCSEARFDDFKKLWGFYRNSVDMPDGTVTSYLLNCLDDDVKKDVHAANADILNMTEDQVMAAIKEYAVQRRAISSLKMDLWRMTQDEGEGIRKFYARVKELAAQCQLTLPCTEPTCRLRHAPYLSYCDEIVKQVVLSGIADRDIRKEVLGVDGINNKNLADTLAIIENKETAARSVAERASSSAAMTTYKKIAASDRRLQGTGKCTVCSKSFKNKRVRSSNKKDDEIVTFTTCLECWKKEHPSSQKKTRNKSGSTDEKAASEENATEADSAPLSFFGSECSDSVDLQRRAGGVDALIRTTEADNAALSFFGSECGNSVDPQRRAGGVDVPIKSTRRRRGRRPPVSMVAASCETIDSMMYDSVRGWVARREDHGRIRLPAYTVPEDAVAFKIAHREVKPTNVLAVADSGCQACLMGLQTLYKLGLKKSDLCRIRSQSTSINGSSLDVIGVVVLRLAGVDPGTGKIVETAAQVRVAEGVKDMFISKGVMKALGIIKADFPSITAAASGVAETGRHGDVNGAETCPGGCKPRTPPPPIPTRLPFEPIEENTEKMKQWLIDHYGSSTFNKCSHQRLPMMSTTPLRIHINKDAEPVAAHNARPVPIHLREKVKAQLDEDVRLGVIERVKVGTPTKWQSRMHVVQKPNGEPRRTVDFRHLNKNCRRENEHIVSPFKQARLIPASVLKTKTDAWNGYHSCPLAEEDRDYTTFITEEGRYRYCVAPQGFVASGDAYNQRFGRVLDRVENKTRCVDDVAMWDKEYETHWWRVIHYLDLVAKNGIVLSPEKFQFSCREIDFAGFRVTDTEVKPLPKYLDAIRDFPRPTNISDIRSWFGLVNQVSSYNKLTELMEPFRKFLSPKVKFYWDAEMEEIFEESKKAIVAAIVQGVQIFDPERRTAISTDYSTTGLGYFMYQKYCDCESTVTTCCPTGWKVTLAGSRFLHKAEQNYWPTEGELLAVAWALHDTRYFTLGCRDLHVQTDHRALVRLLGDKNLDEIDNRRLVNLKEKTMPWSFSVAWVPGTAIPAPDATSRRPQDTPGMPDDFPAAMAAIRTAEVETTDLAGDAEFAALGRLKTGELAAVTWDRVQEETWVDSDMRDLITAISKGFNESVLERLPAGLAGYWKYRHSLHVVDGVVMMGERIVIPPSLRQEVLDHLHGAHQGVSQMTGRAQASFFWPGISSAIANKRHNCRTCDTVAPSQPPTDAIPPEIPTYPFEMVASDFFDLAGSHYLVTVDRFSGWVDVRRAKPDTEESGARGLIATCRETFMTFGVPVEMANDGGPEYKSRAFKDFLKRWGVRLRMSSAYHASSNGRAEAAVRTTKRALRDHTGQDGRLDTDGFTRALLLLRNTPDRDTGKSPAEILLGRRLRDTLPHPYSRQQNIISNDSPVDRKWLEMWRDREQAMRIRMGVMVDKIDAKGHDLAPLEVGDRVRVQNQTGNHKTRWDRTGVVMEVDLQYDQYVVKMDGSRRTTTRNRRFLRKIRADKPAPRRADDEPAHRPEASQRPPETGQRSPPGSPETPAFRTPPSTVRGSDVDLQRRAGDADAQINPHGASPPLRYNSPTATPGQTPAGRRSQGPKRLRFEDELIQPGEQEWSPGQEDQMQQAEPDLPARQSPAERQQSPARPAPEKPAPGPRRSSRATKVPEWHKDYVVGNEAAEMSATEIRRVASVEDESIGVGGMLEDDIGSLLTGGVIPPANVGTSLLSGTSVHVEARAAMAGRVIIAVKEKLLLNGLDSGRVANILGQLAFDIL